MKISKQDPAYIKRMEGLKKYLENRVLTDKQKESLKKGQEALKNYPRDDAFWKKQAEGVRKAFAEGRVSKPSKEIMSKIGKINRSKVCYETLCKANKLLGLRKIGVPCVGKAAKGEGHHKSLYWKIRSPEGIVYEGKNLNEIVRKNANLFNYEDLNWKKSTCRASKGIRNLFDGRHNGPVSWKGWTAVHVQHPSDDPLNRNTIS